MVENITDTFTGNTGYIGYSALGGYIGAWAQSRYNGVTGISPLGAYQVQSLLAGGAMGYIWLLVVTAPDKNTWWKPFLVGVLGAWLYNQWVRALMTDMNVVE